MVKPAAKSRISLFSTITRVRQHLPRAFLLCGAVFVPVSIYRALNVSTSTNLAYTLILYVLNLIGFLLAFRLVDFEPDLRTNINHFFSTAALKLPQFFAVSLVQLLVGTPLFIGLFLILMAVSVGKGSAWLLVLLGLALVLLAMILSIRLSLASVLVAKHNLTSIAALRASAKLVRKNFWRTVWLLSVYFFIAALISTAIFIMLGLIPRLAQNNLAGGVVGGLVLSLLVPIYAYYLSDIVKHYEDKREA